METRQGNAAAPGGALRAGGDKLKDRILAAVSLVLGFLLFELVLFEGFGISMPLFVALFYAAAFWYLSGKPGGIEKRGLWLLIPIALLTACYGLYSNLLLAALNTLLLMALVTLQLSTMTGNRLYKSFSLGYIADLFHTAVALPVVNVPAPFRALKRGQGAGKKSGAAPVLIGLVIALPILLAVLALLASADYVFENSLRGLLEFFARHLLEYAVKIIFGAVMGILFFGLMYALRRNKTIKGLKRNVDFTRVRFMDEGVAGTVFVLVNIVYMLFIAVQFGYLFGAFSSILPSGFNHASYARRGFFELMAVSFINLGMLAFSMLFSRRTGRKRSGFLKAMETALVALTLLLLASAFSKMWFYMDAYGLTALRLYTSWFMLLCAVVFTAVLVKLYIPKFALTRFSAAAFVTLYLGLNFLNVDALIPRYNIDLYKSGKAKTVDMTVFYDLSDAAAPYAAELAAGGDPVLAAKAMEYLNGRADLLNDNRWQTFTLDRYRAQQALIKAGVKAEAR